MRRKRRIDWRKELRTFIYWYVGAYVAGFVAMFITLWVYTSNLQEAWRFFMIAVPMALPQSLTYVQPLVVYLLFLFIRTLVRDYKIGQWRRLTRGFALKVLLPITVFWAYIRIIDLYRHSESFDYTWDTSVENALPYIQNRYAIDQKQRGMHLFNLDADSLELDILNTNNIEWLTFVPYISQSVYNKPPERVSVDTTWMQRRFESMENNMKVISPYAFKVMLKPHIWLQQRPQNTWRSDIAMTSEADWDSWFAFYSEHMLMYASMAEHMGFEMLCIGTELHNTVSQQPDRWRSLITQIRTVYSGKLVYAANWSDDLDEVEFWDQMDYIGLQAYFPIADRNNPDIEELEAAWRRHASSLEALSERYNKPVLFTEIGYKSTPDAARTPWEWERASYRFYQKVSHKTQALSYQAFFNTIWHEPWFAGVHIWHWSSSTNDNGANNRFTVKGKPALNVIAKGFASPAAN